MISVNNKLRRAADCRAICIPEGCTAYPRLVARFPQSMRHYYRDENSLAALIERLQREGISAKEAILIKHFEGRLFQMCPGSPGMICCNYRLVNTGFNCLYNCTYCYLQIYLNSWGIVLFSNMDDVVGEIAGAMSDLSGRVIRIGTGEFTDSLMWDEESEISARLIGALAAYPKLFFELKTKSANVDHLLPIENKARTVIGFSLSTHELARSYEQGASSVSERIEAARRVIESGFLAAFHFDPIIRTDRWREEYGEIFAMLESKIDFARVAWISMGTFRYAGQFKTIMQQNFPGERLSLEEFVSGLDGKFRYPYYMRREVYSHFRTGLEKISRVPFLYMCMENSSMWQDVFGKEYRNSDDLEADFSAHLERMFLAGAAGWQ